MNPPENIKILIVETKDDFLSFFISGANLHKSLSSHNTNSPCITLLATSLDKLCKWILIEKTSSDNILKTFKKETDTSDTFISLSDLIILIRPYVPSLSYNALDSFIRDRNISIHKSPLKITPREIDYLIITILNILCDVFRKEYNNLVKGLDWDGFIFKKHLISLNPSESHKFSSFEIFNKYSDILDKADIQISTISEKDIVNNFEDIKAYFSLPKSKILGIIKMYRTNPSHFLSKLDETYPKTRTISNDFIRGELDSNHVPIEEHQGTYYNKDKVIEFLNSKELEESLCAFLKNKK